MEGSSRLFRSQLKILFQEHVRVASMDFSDLESFQDLSC